MVVAERLIDHASRPKIIVSLMGSDTQSMLNEAQEAVEAGADWLELRADFLSSIDDIDEVCRTTQEVATSYPDYPVLFTFRSKSQGGQCTLAIEHYKALNQAVIAQAHVALVDIEVGIGDENVQSLCAAAHNAQVASVVSYHDFSKTPQESSMVDLLLHMHELGADIAKIAVMAHSSQDAFTLMRASSYADQKSSPDKALIALAMGKAGSITRLAGESFGSIATFCAVGTPSAPGQVPLEVARCALDVLHQANAI